MAAEGVETQIRRVRVGDGHVLVARLMTGQVVAFAPVCPHQFTELDEAAIRDGNLRCPRHGYQYDTRTGENIHPGRDTPRENMWKVRPGFLPCYQVREEGGWISVSDEVLPPPLSYDRASEERPARGIADGAEAEVAAAGPAVMEQSVKFLSVASGSTFDIRLPLVPRPGFSWRFDIVGQLLQVVDEQFEPGYSPCHLIRVAAQDVGAATLSCIYATDRGERAEVRTFIVRIQPP